jgi:hypothetical protein
MSVDLVGSTAFKADKRYENAQDGSPYPKWVKPFENFYTDFPRIMREEYKNITLKDQRHSENCRYPQVWKTIGDEIIFVTV